MSHQNKKRKFIKADTAEHQEMIPKKKFRPFDEKMQVEEQKLTEILFGGAPSFLKSLEEAEQEVTSKDANVDSGVGEEDSDESTENQRKPAWTDDDDGIDVGRALKSQKRKLPQGGINSRDNKYQDLLQHKFVAAYGTPKWASLDKPKEDVDSDDEILQTCGFVKSREATVLPKGHIELKKVKDLNCETYSEGPYINCVEFNHSSTVALVAGSSGVASLYAVDGKRNNKLHNIAFENFPIWCAKFIQHGQEAILGSKQSHAFIYDLATAKAIRTPLPQNITNFKNFIVSPDNQFIATAGRWGEVHLLGAASRERICILKQNSEVTSLAFNPSSRLLYGHSDTGEVTIWDMNMRRVSHKFTDEGCLHGSIVAVASSNQFIATGSAEGVVNLYNTEDVLAKAHPKPRKSIMNLTTRITDLKFNASSEILALSSVAIENSVKLFHIGSNTVFSNFPNFSTKLGHVNIVNFSPNSGYIALGNKKSIVALYRLKHYKNY